MLYIDRVIDRVDKKLADKLTKMEIMFKFPNLYPGTRTVIVLKQPKTEGSIRNVYTPDTVTQKLMILKRMQEKLKQELGNDGYMDYDLMICQANGRPIMTEHLNKRFKDMNALTDYVHSKGLKIGIYSSPGPKTCAGYTGSYQFEEQDAETYALWGFDYLKYDWCSYGSIAPGKTKEDLMKPYRVMREALDKCGRDIVYSLCQYGMGDVWTWGAEVGGNLWRTTSDIVDTWDSVCEIGFSQNGKEPYAGPGHWNDPDMLVIGSVGWGLDVQPSRLTPNEQHSHITLWCLLAAPLLIGCDMSQMDPFTLALLTNDDVLDVNQDPLGKQACRRAGGGWSEVWAKEMSDGTLAVGLFNRRPIAAEITARWEDLGIKGTQPVRDLWRKRDLGQSEGAFTSPVPPHGAVMLKIGKANG